MLLRIFKSNRLVSSLLIPAVGILFWIHSFLSPEQLDIKQANGAMPLYFLVYDLLKEKTFLQVFIAFLLVVINSFFVAQLGSLYLFVRKRSYLAGIIYLITVSSFQVLHVLVPVHLATLFVLLSLYYILATYHNPSEITYTFNASFFLALASLFYLPALILFPLVWIAIFVLQKSDNWRLLVVPILGFGAPWMFLWAFFFLNGTDTSQWNEITKMIWSDHNAYLLEPYFIMLTVVIAFIATLGSLSVLSVYHRMKVSTRKYFVIFYWMLGLVVASALGLITIGIEIVALSTIPVAFFISHFLISESKYMWKEVLTWIYVATMIFSLFFYK